MSKRPTRQHVLRDLIRMRKELDRLINELTTDDDRRFVQSLQHDDITPSTRSPRYDGPEPPDVVAHRWGIDLDHIPSTHLPDWVKDRLSRILD